MNQNNGGGSWATRLWQAVVLLVAVAVAARVVWSLLQPMLSGLIVLAVLVGLYKVLLRRFRGW